MKKNASSTSAVKKAKKGAAAQKPVTSSRKASAKKESHSDHKTQDTWNLRLYVAGQTPKSLAAFSNLKKLCEEFLPGRYEIEVVDLMKNPQLAQSDQIVALPTLVRKLPEPIKRVIGDLSNTSRVMVGIDLESIASA